MKVLTITFTFLLFSIFHTADGQSIFSSEALDKNLLSIEDQNLFKIMEPNLKADFVKIVELTPLSEFEDINNIAIELPLLLVSQEYHLKYIESPSDEEFFWYGESQDGQNSFELLLLDGAYSGGFSVGNDYYEINPLTNNRVIIARGKEGHRELIDHPDLQTSHKHNDKIEESDNNLQSTNRSSCEDPDDIRVLVFYTPNVKNAYTFRQISGKAFQSVANLNAAIINSDGNYNDAHFLRATSAPVELTGFVEHHDDIRDDLTEFKDRVATFNGTSIPIQNLRDEVGADLCILLTECEYTDGGGQFLGFSRTPATSAGDDQRAFSIVDFYSATHSNRRTFTHEVSHLFGGDHLTKEISGIFTQNFALAINPCNPCATGPFQTTHTFPSATATSFGNAAFLVVHKQLRFSKEGSTLNNGTNYGSSSIDNFEQITDRAPVIRNYRTYDPYSVDIQGPSDVNENTTYTWNSFICGCNSSKNYAWERSEDGLNFYPVSSSSTYSGVVTNDSDMYLRLTVTCGGETETDLLYILNTDSGNCTQCSPNVNNSDSDLKDKNILQRTTLYPNPPNDVLNIEFAHEVKGPVVVRIVSQTGNKIMQKSFNRSNNVSLNTKSFENGMYYLVLSIDGEVKTKSFIINRI